MDVSPKDSKQPINIATKGNAILKTFLPESLKSKPKSQVMQKVKESPSPQSEENIPRSMEDTKHPVGLQQPCQPETKPLARIAMVNNMLSKTTTETEVVFLKRGSLGSSEGRRRRSIPQRITHSASDTACNQGRTVKPVTKKRRSMSDYLDMKRGKQSYDPVSERANNRIKLEVKHSGVEQKSENLHTNSKISESNKSQMKNKMNLLRGKLPNVTTWTNKTGDTQTADIKQKEGKVEETLKDKGEVKPNTITNRTRKTSTDMIINALHKKVNTMPGIQSWKLNTFKHKDVPADTLTKTEEMMKELMQEASESKLESPDDENKEKAEDLDNLGFDHKKITLSVKKLTPIPSEEYQSDSDLEDSPQTEIEAPSSPQALTSGRGILKKVSNVEIPNVEEVINLETLVKVKEESNNSPSRMVKFDMPSFDSQTSEELPSITIDLYDVQESSIEEKIEQEPKVLFSDKCTETEALIDTTAKKIPVEDDTYHRLFSEMNMKELDKNGMIETLKDIFKILSGLKTDEVQPEVVSTGKSSYDKVENLAKLESLLRINFNINRKLKEENADYGSDFEEIDEEHIKGTLQHGCGFALGVG